MMSDSVDTLNEQEKLSRLFVVASEIAQGRYERAQTLLTLCRTGECPSLVAELAEAFGLLLVKVEAREFELEQKIEDLHQTNTRLQASLEKIKALEKIKVLLSHFVPSSVSRKLEANPLDPDLKRQEKEVTILFLDIGSFTRLTASTTPAEVNFLVERYFSSFVDDIFAQGGEICESQGDGLLLIFEPVRVGDKSHVLRAAHAALAIQKRVQQINAGLPSVERFVAVNIGIETGLAMVGSTCFQGFTDARWTYSAYGMTVNRAARFGGFAQGGQIIIGKRVEQMVNSTYKTMSLGLQKLKNIAEPVPLWQLCLRE